MFIAAIVDGVLVAFFWDTWWNGSNTAKGKLVIWSKLEQLHKISIVVLILGFFSKVLIVVCLYITSMGSKASKDGIYITEMNDLNLSFEEKEAREEMKESEENEANEIIPKEKEKEGEKQTEKKSEKKSLWF